MSLLEDNSFISNEHANRAIAFWGNNSVAVYRLIEELNNEAGKWITPIDDDAIYEATQLLKRVQVIMYRRYRDYISEKIGIICADLDKEVHKP